jgi:hypothetical protein
MSHADRPPSRRTRRLWPAMVLVLGVVVLSSVLWTSSSLKEDDDGAGAGSAEGGSGLSEGVDVWDDMDRVRGLTSSAGERLQSSVRELSDEGEVQAATLAVAWQTTCSVVSGEVQLERRSIAAFVLDRGASFGVSFLDHGEDAVADAVLTVIHDSANDAAEKCDDLRNAGF